MGCQVIKIDENITAIVYGAPADHKCNEDGRILLLSNGERIEHTDENLKKHIQNVVGGSVCCTICGHAAIDDFKYQF